MVTASCRSSSRPRTSPTTSSCSGLTFTPRPALVSGYRRARSAIIASSSCCAASRVAPGARRPTTKMMCESRTAVRSPPNGKVRGTPRSPVSQTSMPSCSGDSNPGGITPTIVYGRPSSITERPRASGDAPNSRVHRPWLNTAALAAAGSSSEGSSVRPRAAVAPSVGNRVPEAPSARRRSGSPRPDSVGANSSNAASDEKARVSRRQSTKFAGATQRSGLSRLVSHTIISLSGSSYGSGLRTTWWRTLKMAALAPMPSARDRTAADARPGRRRNSLTPSRRSLSMVRT